MLSTVLLAHWQLGNGDEKPRWSGLSCLWRFNALLREQDAADRVAGVASDDSAND